MPETITMKNAGAQTLGAEKKKKIVIRSRYPKEDFIKIFNMLCEGRDKEKVWQDFVLMTACTISNSDEDNFLKSRRTRHRNAVGKYTSKEQFLFVELYAITQIALTQHPEQDFLGYIGTEIGIIKAGEPIVYTAYPTAKKIADIFYGDVVKEIKSNGHATLLDTSCGSGSSLLAEIQMIKDQGEKIQGHVKVDAYEEDEILGLMCYIQLSLIGTPGMVCVKDKTLEKNQWIMPYTENK